MQVKQYTTYQVDAKAYKKEYTLDPVWEADEEKMMEANIINLYPDFTYQTIEGFGGAMTESAAYLFARMDEKTQEQALAEYFGGTGMHTKFVRVPIDSCDYSLEEYQAVADPIADPKLQTFTIDRDRKYVLPMLKKAIAMSKEPLEVLMSPWSPPYQWKTAPKVAKNDLAVYGMVGIPIPEDKPQRNYGGSLKREYYGPWATYVVKYVKAYLEEGIPVTMLTLQNETIAATTWDSCIWTPEESKIYLKDYLYPEMKKEGLLDKIGLYIWDHNKERMIDHVTEVLDEETMSMVRGIAFHWYSGDHFEAVDMIRQKYPQMNLMLSECCGLHKPGQKGLFGPSFGGAGFDTAASVDYEDAVAYAHDIIGNLNAGMNRWIDWNFIVDEEGGPRHVKMGFVSGLIADEEGGYRKPLHCEYMEHFSGYILPGAVRIGTTRANDELEVTAAKNTDGSYVAVILNKYNKDNGCYIRLHGYITRVSIPANTISTIVLTD